METRQTKLNPLRSRHASQGTLVLPMAIKPSKIAVTAARSVSTTAVTPFSSDQSNTPESEDVVHTGGNFLSVNTISPIQESARSFRHGSAKNVPNSNDGSPKAVNRRNNPSVGRNVGTDDMKVEEADITKERPTTLAQTESSPSSESDQYSRTQNQNQNQNQHQQRQARGVLDEGSVAARLRSTGLTYDDVIESPDVEDLCLLLGLSRKDVRQLRRQFNDEDGDNTETITQSAFFFLIGEERHNLSRQLFRIAGLPPTQPRLSFDQYLMIIATFATFTEAELLKFFYDVYCSDTKSGAMIASEIQNLGEELRKVSKGTGKNVALATKNMVSSRNVMAVAAASTPSAMKDQPTETIFTFADFEKIVRKNLVAFFPLIRMQHNVRRATMGEAFWVAKTRDKKAVQNTLAYMQQHQGRLPELSLKDKFFGSIFRWETPGARVRSIAGKLYAAGERNHDHRATI